MDFKQGIDMIVFEKELTLLGREKMTGSLNLSTIDIFAVNNTLLWEIVLNIVGCLSAFLTSSH